MHPPPFQLFEMTQETIKPEKFGESRNIKSEFVEENDTNTNRSDTKHQDMISVFRAQALASGQ